MPHLSRRFSGFVFLYIVIAYFVFAVLFNLGIYFSSTINSFFVENYTLFMLLFRLVIFLPPIIFIAAKRYPAAGILRLNTFSGRQLFFAVGLSIFIYLFIRTFGSMLENLFYGLFLPDFHQQNYFHTEGFSILPYILTSCLIPAILYELTFRGAVQSGFRNISPLRACFIVGILYGLFQMDFLLLIQYTVFGFVLCYISNKTNSIIPGMFTAFLVLFFSIINLDGLLYYGVLSSIGISQGLTAFFVALVSIIIGGLLLWKMPYTGDSSRPIKMSRVRAFFRKLLELRRRYQDSFISDHDENEDRTADKQQENIVSEPASLNKEIYPDEGPKQNKNTGFIIGSIVLIAYLLFQLGYSIYYYIDMTSRYFE